MNRDFKKRRILSKLIYQPENKIINKSTKDRIFPQCEILHEGKYADSITMDYVSYKSDVLAKYYDNWQSNYLDIDHSIGECLKRIGFVENPTWDSKNKCIRADLRIMPVTQNARDVIALMTSKPPLISDLSVEMYTHDEYDYEEDCIIVSEISLCGTAVVTIGADDRAKVNV